MRRVTCRELLDDDLGTPEEIGGNLDDLWRINRWLGGVSSNLRMFARFFAAAGRHPVRILEIGCGDGRLAGHLTRQLARRGVRAQFFLLDRRPSHLKHGRGAPNRLPALAADALNLPFAPASFDLVISNLLFHHFSGESARSFLQSVSRVAREAVLINDLERHLLPYLFIRAAPWFTRGRLSRHDGPASVRQAYTAQELRALAREVGFDNFEVRRLIPFRLGLTVWKRPRNGGTPEAPSLAGADGGGARRD